MFGEIGVETEDINFNIMTLTIEMTSEWMCATTY